MRQNVCKYCEHKWAHPIGGMCPSCHRFQVSVVEHNSFRDSQMNTQQKEYPASNEGVRLMRYPLWPKQSEIYNATLRELRDQNWSLWKIGMRGGKDMLVARVAAALDVDKVFVFDTHPTLCDALPIRSYFCESRIPKSIIEGRTENQVAIINNAFWLKDSFDLFNELRNCIRVIAMGSNGPEFVNDKRWQALQGHSFATWEINPNCTEREMRENDQNNSRENYSEQRFQRDFGKF